MSLATRSRGVLSFSHIQRSEAVKLQAIEVLGAEVRTVPLKEEHLVGFLLQMSCECGSQFNLVHREERGLQVRYYLQCNRCRGMRVFANIDDTGLASVTVDDKIVKGLRVDLLETVFVALLGGNTYTTYR